MRRWLLYFTVLLGMASCDSAQLASMGNLVNPPEEGTDQEKPATPDPEFTVTGAPEGAVKAYTTFKLSVSSKSDASIGFVSSRPDVAKIVLSARREYKVTTFAPEAETPVTITFTQDAKGKYPEVVKEVVFSVLPESTEAEPTAPSATLPDLAGIKVSFKESTSLVVNPERGHYRAKNIYNGSSPISVSEVKAQRIQGYTLWYLGFYLTDFMEGEISQSFLDNFQECMNALRQGGSKCVLRFAYRDYHNDSEEMDPEVDIVLGHVAQLKPLLQANEDVIFVLQAGFVGAWGEWYYTSHFGFAPRTDADYAPRKQLADALLDALPVSRQIELRTPQFKMRMYSLTVKDTLTAATAHDGSFKSRLAGHNDCFGASADDYGTFDNETKDREFWKGDTRYTIMGGETCGVSDYCTCESTRKDLTDYHWTYLNKDYNTDVLNRWKSGGCYNDFVARLGYRLVLRDLFYSEDFSAGKPCEVTLRFYNTGFAAPMNPRDAVLVWVSPSGEREETPLGSDPRTWHSGYHAVSASFTPSTDKGTLYLRLSDPLLPSRPEYSIAFANEGVFEAETGMNKLFER